MTASLSLHSVPQEVLEHIAFFAATQSPIGPPSGLLPILLTCRAIYQALSLEANPYVYSRIFNYEFDTDSAFRRLGPHIRVPRVLADELSKRWTYLKRMRPGASPETRDLIETLWLALLMMLENEGKNERQLLDYVKLDTWLMVYLFGAEGVSFAAGSVLRDEWPVEGDESTIAMWLFWLLLRPDDILKHIRNFPHMMPIMRLTTLAAHHYPICRPDWAIFRPASGLGASPCLVTHFSDIYRLMPPPPAPAVILSFLTLTSRMSGGRGSPIARNPFWSFLNFSSAARRSDDWDPYWHRCISLGGPDCSTLLSNAYALGSLEGVWEGIFAYTEFDVYLDLLTGDVPSSLDRCSLGHHSQTWRLREYYLVKHSQEEHATERFQPLGPGHPLNAHFALGTRFQELSDSVQVLQPNEGAVCYRRWPSRKMPDDYQAIDVIILGEGHSAWGQFSLYGRVRPLDGLISLSKVYVEGDRGQWLYRGYLVGNTNGHISGRWRDSLSPADVPGYEGCFAMSRRK